MIKGLICLLSCIFLTGCAQVYFASPQPQKGITVKSFIDDIQGTYSDSLLCVVIEKQELVIEGDRYKLTSGLPAKHELLVKYYNDFYFASFKEADYYVVFMAKFYNNKMAIYLLNADQRSISVLSRFIKVDTLNTEKKSYLVDPTKKEFSSMVENGAFEVMRVLEKN